MKHFTIKDTNTAYEVEVLSSFYNETINNKKEYKVYKSEVITYAKNESTNLPKAMAINRVLETSAGCTNNETYIKKSSLRSIRD